MKVLWLRPSKGDNISIRRERIAEHMRKRGVEIDILDASGYDSLTAIRHTLTGGYNMIAGNTRIGLYIGYPVARLLRIPFVGDVSDPISDIDYLPGPLFAFFRWYEWFVLKRADAAVFVYESSYREARERGIDAVKLPNAVDYGQFADPDDRVVQQARRMLESHGVDFDSPVAIYVGALTAGYHITDILEAADETPEWEFVFVGEGPLAGAVTAAEAVSTNVHYPGAFDHELIPGFLAHADAGFCFKDAEQPLKLKEYGAAGVPTIVQPGELEAWYDDEDLLFVEPTKEHISEILGRIRRGDLGEQQGVGLQQKARASSWEDVAEQYHGIFESLVSGSFSSWRGR